jgi:pyridinium-3,5-biscarboxylic acid mononucleotide synthase
MEEDRLRALLEEVRLGTTPIDEAVGRLRDLPYEDLGFAKLDHHRSLRNGFPEVIYCQGKTLPQITAIAGRLRERSHKVLATRATPEVAAVVRSEWPDAVYHEAARIVVVPGAQSEPPPAPNCRGTVLVVTAGTADVPVAEEAAVTAREMGSPVETLYDVGVAGLHRLLDHKERLFSASVLIVVAGMEGALASVVGGLVRQPVIAVPTSVGYGASFQGLAALLTMLNSCASGVSVMNIDNGFGAGYFAHLVNRM